MGGGNKERTREISTDLTLPATSVTGDQTPVLYSHSATCPHRLDGGRDSTVLLRALRMPHTRYNAQGRTVGLIMNLHDIVIGYESSEVQPHTTPLLPHKNRSHQRHSRTDAHSHTLRHANSRSMLPSSYGNDSSRNRNRSRNQDRT